MNWLDIVILVILAISLFTGLTTGLIKQVITFAGFILGLLLAGRFYTTLAPRLTFIEQDNIARIAAFAIIFIGVLIIAAIVASTLKKVASVIMLGWLDHLGGAAVGLLMGALFCGALLALWVNYIGAQNVIRESFLASFLLDKMPLVLALLPDEFDSIRPYFQ